MTKIEITDQTERYIENVAEYAKLTNKTELLKDETGFSQVCREYNEAYEKFTEKFITLQQAIDKLKEIRK